MILCLRRALYAAVEFVVLVVLMFGIPALVWLMAPEGAAYPR